MLIQSAVQKEGLMEALTNSDARRILASTISSPKSISEMSSDLSIPTRSVYRHVEELCSLGLLTVERSVLLEGGGKFALYRSMVKSVKFTYEGNSDEFSVDLFPNDGIIYKFMKFWTLLGS